MFIKLVTVFLVSFRVSNAMEQDWDNQMRKSNYYPTNNVYLFTNTMENKYILKNFFDVLASKKMKTGELISITPEFISNLWMDIPKTVRIAYLTDVVRNNQQLLCSEMNQHETIEKVVDFYPVLLGIVKEEHLTPNQRDEFKELQQEYPEIFGIAVPQIPESPKHAKTGTNRNEEIVESLDVYDYEKLIIFLVIFLMIAGVAGFGVYHYSSNKKDEMNEDELWRNHMIAIGRNTTRSTELAY